MKTIFANWKTIFANWKTTSIGITAIFGALVMLWFRRHELTEGLVMAAFGAVMGGLGLIFARDSDKTSEDSGVSFTWGKAPPKKKG